MRLIVLLSMIGGFGLGVSFSVHYFQVTFFITLSVNAFDLGFLTWVPIGVVALLAIVTGFDLNGSIRGNPERNLIISMLLIGVSGFLLLLTYNNYSYASPNYYGMKIPLNFGPGLIIAIISGSLVVMAFILLEKKKNIYIQSNHIRRS